ncbi:hypothetical protein Sta7437_3566 [Stanieria cyanosphaera PCC 7437]|uniref:Uncharacterized protein n=1 Tax=Stanieria cyanosphaera (strain ATCC 29371 / PCC 7437) TaxID=111780 RepID=K9XYF6_STAC7|nr:hypothetical protein [Stanieria cyanosphaera]AFZ37064.1 hypothetical protein Sta7437_3566 [Stanieria cyanosphaera PCC 7437]
MIKKLVLAFVLVMASSTDVAQANSTSPTLIADNLTLVTNGLFTPTAAQRFFEEGKQQFEQEEQKFKNNSGFSTEQILQLPDNFDFTTPPKDRKREFLLQPQDLSKLF